MEIDQFISQFGGLTESYLFYNNTVQLRFDIKKHIYYLVTQDGLVTVDGVTNSCHIIDKSDALIAWAVKMMAQKLLATIPRDTIAPDTFIAPMSYGEFEQHVLAAKSAHKDKLDEASNIGHLAHNWIEQCIKYELNSSQGIPYIPMPENEQARNCCRAAVAWMLGHNIRWICTERKVYSRDFKYAGTMDGLCWVDSCQDPKCCREEFKDRLSLADWKTSNDLYPEYLLQTAAYMNAYMEEFPDQQIVDRWVIRLGKEDAKFDPWHVYGSDYEEDLDAFLDTLHLSRSLEVVKDRMKERHNVAKAIIKEEKRIAKEVALAVACKRSAQYMGIRKPKCNGGNPCQTCLAKYQERHGE